MSSTANDAKSPGALPASNAHRYFRAIEDCFLAWRGSPLTLGSNDWQLARRWFDAEVPLTLVTETLESLFERRDQEGKDKVASLRYFRAAVEKAWDERQEFLAPAKDVEGPEIDVGARLAALGRALPGDLPARQSWLERLESLQGSPQTVETALQALDAELQETLREALPEALREQLQNKLETSLARLAGRLPEDELERAGGRLREQLLRQQARLPVLSLFSPEALAD